MPLETEEIEWIKKVAKVKTEERNAVKARLEQHLVKSGRAAAPSKLDASATAEQKRDDYEARETERARREDQLQNVVADKLEISANTVFALDGALGDVTLTAAEAQTKSLPGTILADEAAATLEVTTAETAVTTEQAAQRIALDLLKADVRAKKTLQNAARTGTATAIAAAALAVTTAETAVKVLTETQKEDLDKLKEVVKEKKRLVTDAKRAAPFLPAQADLKNKAAAALAKKPTKEELQDPELRAAAKKKVLATSSTLTGPLLEDAIDAEAKKHLIFTRDRALAQRLDPADLGTYKFYDDKGKPTTDPLPAAAQKKVDQIKLNIEIDNALNDEIAAKIATQAPPDMAPLTRNEKIEGIVATVAAKYGITNLAHLIGRHGAERTNPDTGTVTRTNDDMVGRLVGGVGADQKAATIASSSVALGNESAQLFGTTGSGTGDVVTIPAYTTVGTEAAIASSQHASAKAAIYMMEEASAEAARLESQIGSKALKAEDNVEVDVGKEAIGEEQLGSYGEEGKLGKRYTLPPTMKPKKGAAINPGDMAERIRQTKVIKDNPTGEVTLIPDAVHGGVNPMTMFTKSDKRTARAASNKQGRANAYNRDDQEARKVKLDKVADKATARVKQLTDPGGPQQKAQEAAAQAEVKRDKDDKAADTAIKDLSVPKQLLATNAKATAIDAAKAEKKRDQAKELHDKAVELEAAASAQETRATEAATATVQKATKAAVDAKKELDAAELELVAADEALKLASGDLTKIKAKAEKEAKVAEAQFASTQANSSKELAKEEEERQKALHAENVKSAKALVKKRKEEHEVVDVAATEALKKRDEAYTQFSKDEPAVKADAVKAKINELATSSADAGAKAEESVKVDKMVTAAQAKETEVKRTRDIAAVKANIAPADVQAEVPGCVKELDGKGVEKSGAAGLPQIEIVAQAVLAAVRTGPGKTPIAQAAFDAKALGKTFGDILAAATTVAMTHALPEAIKIVAPNTTALTPAVCKTLAQKISEAVADVAAKKADTGDPVGTIETGVSTIAVNAVLGDIRTAGHEVAVAAVEAAVRGADEVIAQITARFANHPAASPLAVKAAADAAALAAKPKAKDAAKTVDDSDIEQVKALAYQKAFTDAFAVALPAAQSAFDIQVKAEADQQKLELAKGLKDALNTGRGEFDKKAAEQKKGLTEQKDELVKEQEARAAVVAEAKKGQLAKEDKAKESKKSAEDLGMALPALKDKPQKAKEKAAKAKLAKAAHQVDLDQVEEQLKTDATVGTGDKLKEAGTNHAQLKEQIRQLGEEADGLKKDVGDLERGVDGEQKKLKASTERADSVKAEKATLEKSLLEAQAKEKEVEALRVEAEQLDKTLEKHKLSLAAEAKDIEQLSEKVQEQQKALEALQKAEKQDEVAIESARKTLGQLGEEVEAAKGKETKSKEALAAEMKARATLETNSQELSKTLSGADAPGELAKRLQEAEKEQLAVAKETATLEESVQKVQLALSAKRKEQETNQEKAETAVAGEKQAAEQLVDAEGKHEDAKQKRLAAEARKLELTAAVKKAGEEQTAAEEEEQESAAAAKKAEEIDLPAAKAQQRKDEKASREAERVAKRMEVEQLNRKEIAEAEVELADAEHEARVAQTIVDKGSANPTETKAALVAEAMRKYAEAKSKHAGAVALQRRATVKLDSTTNARDLIATRLTEVEAATKDVQDQKTLGAVPLTPVQEKVLKRVEKLQASKLKAEQKVVKLTSDQTPLELAEQAAGVDELLMKTAWENSKT